MHKMKETHATHVDWDKFSTLAVVLGQGPELQSYAQSNLHEP